MLTHKYPQNTWSSEILKLFNSGTIVHKNQDMIWDSPCGNGIIGHLVFKGLKDAKLTVLDNNPQLKNSPYVQILDKNFSHQTKDIFEWSPEGEQNTWLLVNSLYCLPNVDQLISGNKMAFKNIIGIFPDIHQSNFLFFKSKNPEFSNPSLMSVKETIQFFEKQGYKLAKRKMITHIPFHKWNQRFDKLHFPIKLKNIILTLLDKLLFFLPGQYALLTFVRHE